MVNDYYVTYIRTTSCFHQSAVDRSLAQSDTDKYTELNDRLLKNEKQIGLFGGEIDSRKKTKTDDKILGLFKPCDLVRSCDFSVH